MKTKIIFKIGIIATIMLFMSCSEEWLKEEPPHLITTVTLYSNFAGFESGLNGLYDKVRLYYRCQTYGEFFLGGTDNCVVNFKGGGWTQVMGDWGGMNNSQNADNFAIFLWFYEIINAANTIINSAENNEDIDWSGGQGTMLENKNRVIAEAMFFRAWAYRHAAFLWGDVPLSLDESRGSTIKMNWERTPVMDVWKQIKSDLLFAEEYLTVEPPRSGSITKGAVQHYLSELYLVLEMPDSALFWANKCINTPNYKLITSRYGVKSTQPGVPFMDMFFDGNVARNQGNTEALWVMPFEYGVPGGGLGDNMVRFFVTRYYSIRISGVAPFSTIVGRGGRGIGRLAPTIWSLENYEPQDERFSHFAIRKFYILGDAVMNAPNPADRLPPGYAYGDTIWLDMSPENEIKPGKVGVVNHYCTNKFDAARAEDVAASDQFPDRVYLRLAETYLLKAEAQFLLGLKDDAAATINIIRNRSKATPVNGSQIDMDFILDERSRELLFEEQRRFTLLRTGTWLERTKKYNKYGGHAITERDKLLPIPQPVIDTNITTIMPQNPGY